MHKHAKYCYFMLKLQKLAENDSKQHFERCPMVCSQAIPNSVAAAETFQELMLQTWLVIESSSFTKHWCNLSNGHTNWRRLNASASISSSCKECNLTSKSKKMNHLLALLWTAPCLASAVQALVNRRVILEILEAWKLGLWHSRDFGLWIFLAAKLGSLVAVVLPSGPGYL